MIDEPKSLAELLALIPDERELFDTHEDLLKLARGVLLMARAHGVRKPRILHLAQALQGAADDALAEAARRRVEFGATAEEWAASEDGQTALESFLAEILGVQSRDNGGEGD